MASRGKHRKALVWAAARLFRRQGYAGTGLADILAASGAPRGSLYHYFPGGKEAIGAAAVEAAGGLVSATLAELAASAASPAAFVRDYADMLERWLAASGYRDGCPITTTLLEMAPESEAITAAGRTAFANWQKTIADLLCRHGWSETEAESLALAVIGGLEGALLLARVQGNGAPLHAAAAALGRLLASPATASADHTDSMQGPAAIDG